MLKNIIAGLIGCIAYLGFAYTYVYPYQVVLVQNTFLNKSYVLHAGLHFVEPFSSNSTVIDNNININLFNMQNNVNGKLYQIIAHWKFGFSSDAEYIKHSEDISDYAYDSKAFAEKYFQQMLTLQFKNESGSVALLHAHGINSVLINTSPIMLESSLARLESSSNISVNTALDYKKQAYAKAAKFNPEFFAFYKKMLDARNNAKTKDDFLPLDNN